MNTAAILKLLQIQPIASRDELISACAEAGKTQLQRDALILQMDAELQIVRDKYAHQIETFNSEIKHETRRIKTWADDHREAEFGKKQSLVIAGHALEYRKGSGKVEADEDAVVAKILALPGAGEGEPPTEGDLLRERYLKVTATLNKSSVLSAWRSKDASTRQPLINVGLDVVAEETFSFTPAREELPGSVVQPGEEASA